MAQASHSPVDFHSVNGTQAEPLQLRGPQPPDPSVRGKQGDPALGTQPRAPTCGYGRPALQRSGLAICPGACRQPRVTRAGPHGCYKTNNNRLLILQLESRQPQGLIDPLRTHVSVGVGAVCLQETPPGHLKLPELRGQKHRVFYTHFLRERLISTVRPFLPKKLARNPLGATWPCSHSPGPPR